MKLSFYAPNAGPPAICDGDTGETTPRRRSPEANIGVQVSKRPHQLLINGVPSVALDNGIGFNVPLIEIMAMRHL